MRKTIAGLLVCLTFALVLLSSCASTSEKAAKALDNGDYTTAISQSLKSLEDEKDVVEAEMYLQDAWERANIEWNAQIATIEQSTTAAELHKAISVYNKLLDIHEMIQNAGRNDLKPNRSAILEKALVTQKRIADLYFEEASATLALGGRENARTSLVKLGKVKDLIPEYPDLDKTIAETTKLAMVKVIVSFEYDRTNLFDYAVVIPLVEKKLDALPFVEIIPFSTAKDPKKQGADLLVHITPKLSHESKLEQERRPINNGVTAAPNWQIEKISMVTSVRCFTNYSVTDMKTGTVLSSGSFDISDSTDYDFSVSAILSTGEKENVQIGSMPERKTMLINSLAPGRNALDLTAELWNSEKIKINTNPVVDGTRYFDDIKTPKDLANIQNLNGHTFFLFDFIKSTMVIDGKSKEMYYSSYNTNHPTNGVQADVKAAEYDRKLYANVKNWIVNKNHFATETEFLNTMVKNSVPETLAEKIAPVLK
jgi:hypothetical protein